MQAIRASYATLLSNYVVAGRLMKGELAQDEAKLQVSICLHFSASCLGAGDRAISNLLAYERRARPR